MGTGVASWSKTAASNATADSNVNWAEGQSPASVNDSSRAEMASVAMYRDDVAGSLTTGGTSTAYTVTTNQGFATLSALDGHTLTVRFNATNGVSPTLNVDGLGAKSIKLDITNAVATGAILADSIHRVTYDNANTCFILHDALASYIATSADAGASTFTALDVYRNSASPAASDFLGKVQFNGKDSGGNKTAYAEIDSQIVDPTNASEDGKLVLRTMNAGSLADTAALDSGGLTMATGMTVTAGRFLTRSDTIADDAVLVLSAPSNSGLLIVTNTSSPGATRPYGIIAYRASGASVAPVTVAWNDQTNIAYTTGVLAGTTGANDKLTFSCNNNGNIYVENRLGASVSFIFTFVG